MSDPNEIPLEFRFIYQIEAAVRNPPDGKRLYDLVKDHSWFLDNVYEEVGCLRKEVRQLTRLVQQLVKCLDTEVLPPPNDEKLDRLTREEAERPQRPMEVIK